MVLLGSVCLFSFLVLLVSVCFVLFLEGGVFCLFWVYFVLFSVEHHFLLKVFYFSEAKKGRRNCSWRSFVQQMPTKSLEQNKSVRLIYV